MKKLSERFFAISVALALFLLGVFLGGCDGDTINEITEIIACQLPPGHCDMNDEEFAVMFEALTPEEQTAYTEEWGKPEEQRGFVSR